MAFNQGPQPKVVLNENGIRYVDPNPTDEIVNHEDLVMYVKLVARSKGRSILTYNADTDQTTTIVDQKNVKSETNFTYPTGKDYIDTSWTNIGGGNLNFGEDLGSFGITNINIEFKSSFMPQIVIDFVDVRGAALFEQGPCSPYAIFFHLPYPVFELTVKGYYGRPVTYTLALVKFNTKFNSDTGNFESKAEFVGYTYAFLADIPMGYVMAASFMENPHNGKNILADKWKLLISKGIIDKDSFTDQNEPITIYDLIKKAKALEQRTSELKNTKQVTDLGKINKTKNELNSLRAEVLKFKTDFMAKIGNSENGGHRASADGQKNTVFLKLPNNDTSNTNPLLVELQKIVETYFGKGENSQLQGQIGTKLNTVKTYYEQNSLENSPSITWDVIIKNASGFFGTTINVTDNLRDYYIDIYESLLKPIDVSITEINKLYVDKKDETKNFLNAEVIKTLGFLPTISNVFAIILTNVEVFLELLLKTSRDAELYHQEVDVRSGLSESGERQILDLKGTQNSGAKLSDTEENNQKNKVYPWPTYYEKKSGSPSEVGDKETYPGENAEFVTWPEVIFVEAFIKALTKLKGELAVLELQMEDLPGYDNFAPITPYETHAFGETGAPNRWLKVQDGNDGKSYAEYVYQIMGENAFLLGDYTMINSLSVWKSQLGFKNGWGQETLTNGGPVTSGLGYSDAADRYFLKPQRLAENPKVNINDNNLNRYGGEGFRFPTEEGKNGSFKRKISPTTKERIKEWGKVDALNLMTTLKLDNGQPDILTFLKNYVGDTSKKSDVISEIKKALKDKLKEETFDEWKVSATAAISGTTDLVTKQNLIWQNYFQYVKNAKVLSLKGPIELNRNVESANGLLIHANPHENPGGGAVLINQEELAVRNIDFSNQSLPDKIKTSYKKYFANTEDTKSEIAEGTGSAVDTTSLAYRLLKYRPKTAKNLGNTAYISAALGRDDVNLSRDKNTNILTLNEYFAPVFYHTYKNASKEMDSNQNSPIFDLCSSRTVYDNVNSSTVEWANFMGSSVYNTNTGSADAIINTPLWTLNYPLWKNSWNYAEGNETNGLVALDEVVSIKTGSKGSFATYKPGDNGVPLSRSNNGFYNQRTNWSTWWGLNQWGVGSSSDIYKPLAYMAVMSLGFDNLKSEYRTGHFPPWDGDSDEDLSSFSNFTYSAIMAYPPKSYILLIGAILWRMKESGLLWWDGIKPTGTFTFDGENKGWNKFNKSYNYSNDQNIGIDDLNDPVWFFHTSTSRPWFKGGSVYSIPSDNPGIPLGNGSNYERRWLGQQKGVDRWTNGGGSIFKESGTQLPVVIGGRNGLSLNIGSLNAANFNKTTSNDAYGWIKSHDFHPGLDMEASADFWANVTFTITLKPLPSNGSFRTAFYRNVTRGFFDQCRPDQIPFIYSDKGRGKKFTDPKTLVITSLPGSIKGLNFVNDEPQYSNPNYSDRTPSLSKNKYPILKEECKELMFIPKSLKEQFISFFENWATSGDQPNWLLSLDPLNWNDNGGLDDWSTTNGGGDNSYILKGYKGFLSSNTRKNRKYLTNVSDEDNYYRKHITTIDEGDISGTKPKPKKKPKTSSNSTSDDVGYEPQFDVSCFVAGSKIKLSNGKDINIEDLNVGDIVLSYNVNTNTFEESNIENVIVDYKQNLVIYYFDNGIKITCTDTHPLWVNGKGWSSYRQTDVNDSEHIGPTKQITTGDECFYYSNNNFNKVKISKIIEKQNKMVRVWNIKNVTGNHNFIINNVLVHNMT